MPVPEHLRENHERTDDALNAVYGLATCLDTLSMNASPKEDSREDLAQITIINLMLEKLSELERLRSFEWVGIGGNTDNLTADEIALARGENATCKRGAA